jgi:dTDP-4-dehydrorhamnose reductase
MEAGKRVLVTGAGGMLARDLIPTLAAQGFAVTGLTRAELDIAHPPHLNDLIRHPSAPWDWIINGAAYTAVDQAESEAMAAFRANAIGPGALAAWAKANGARLITLSTDYVFDGQAARPYREDDPTDPQTVYGKTKRAGEENALREDQRSLIVRTSWLFGRKGKCFPRTMLERAKSGQALRVVNDQTGCPTATDDLAAALVKLIQANPEGGIYHLCGPEAMTWFAFAERVLARAEALVSEFKVPEISPVASTEFPTPARRPAWSVLGTERADAIGVTPLGDLDAAIDRIVGAWRAEQANPNGEA